MICLAMQAKNCAFLMILKLAAFLLRLQFFAGPMWSSDDGGIAYEKGFSTPIEETGKGRAINVQI